MHAPSNPKWGTITPIVAAVLLLIGGMTIVLTDSDEDGKPEKTTITFKVDTLDASPDADKTVTVPEVAVEQAEEGITAKEDHTGARDETPEGVPEAQLEANVEAIQENRATTEALPTAGASGGFPGCATSFVRNQSSRRGVRPTVQVLHYTVSPNRPGRSDVNGITAYFNRSSSQASSNFVIDAEGNCNYIVPIEAKAWTQGGGNPWAVSYEIIATGRESSYLGAKGYSKLRSVMQEVSRRTKIPMRTGRISGCSPSRSGIVQHANGGSCWGGHHDIGPFNFASVVRRVTTSSCNRTCDLRKRHSATHKQLKGRSCSPPDTTKSESCKTLHRRHTAIHNAAKRERIKL